MLEGINNIDLAVIVVLLFSALTACFRGFFKEIFSIIGWILTALITAQALPYVQPIAREQILSQTVADFVASAGIFILILIIWSIITGRVIKKLRSSSLSGFDRLLGFGFGILRGSFLVSLTYLFASFLISKEDLNFVLEDTVSQPYLESASNFLERMVPEEISKEINLSSFADSKEKQTNNLIEKIMPTALDELKESGGYDEIDRENLNKLIENNFVHTEELEEP